MDFFMQLDFINDAFIDTQSRTITLRQTNLNTLCEAIENGPCSMCCVQQVLILMYGIMARFGHYNTIIENIVVERTEELGPEEGPESASAEKVELAHAADHTRWRSA